MFSEDIYGNLRGNIETRVAQKQ